MLSTQYSLDTSVYVLWYLGKVDSGVNFFEYGNCLRWNTYFEVTHFWILLKSKVHFQTTSGSEIWLSQAKQNHILKHILLVSIAQS